MLQQAVAGGENVSPSGLLLPGDQALYVVGGGLAVMSSVGVTPMRRWG